MNTLPYRALVKHTEEPIQLAWGGTQVQNTPTFFKEVELPIELDELEGSPRSIAAHKQYELVLQNLRRIHLGKMVVRNRRRLKYCIGIASITLDPLQGGNIYQGGAFPLLSLPSWARHDSTTA